MHTPTTSQLITDLARERRYADAVVRRWLALDPTDAEALLDLALELRLGENQLLDFWQWIEDVAARDRVPFAAVLASTTVEEARRRKFGRNEKLKEMKDALRRLRFPQLAAAEARARQLLRDLALPRNVHAELPQALEGGHVELRVEIGSPAELRQVADALRQAADSEACTKLFDLLDGQDV